MILAADRVKYYIYELPLHKILGKNGWLSERLQNIQFISNEDTAVLQ